VKSAYLMAAMPAEAFLRVLLRNGISPAPCFLLRALFILQSGLFASFLAFRERMKNGARIAHARPPSDPLIIVNHWRTGSTLLHQLINCDPQFSAPTLFQVTYPASFMSSRLFVEPIMKRMLLPTRPMDNVRLGMDEPMEEEDALFRMSGISPLERLLFPRGGGYFLLDDQTFLPSGQAQDAWEQALVQFTAKLGLHTGRRIVLKNPFHSMRIAILQRLFPDAKFIHIYRNPRIVIPSTVRMWSIVGRQNAMNRRFRPPSMEDVIEVFDRMLTRIRADLADMPADRFAEVRFEEFVKHPVSVVRSLYDRLNLHFSDQCGIRMRQFIQSVAGYKMNSYTLTAQQESMICTRLASHIQKDGY
jgi:hypothetical protein